jgi:hypothetical protein
MLDLRLRKPQHSCAVEMSKKDHTTEITRDLVHEGRLAGVHRWPLEELRLQRAELGYALNMGLWFRLLLEGVRFYVW